MSTATMAAMIATMFFKIADRRHAVLASIVNHLPLDSARSSRAVRSNLGIARHGHKAENT